MTEIEIAKEFLLQALSFFSFFFFVKTENSALHHLNHIKIRGNSKQSSHETKFYSGLIETTQPPNPHTHCRFELW
jgi:hypothetical protein